MLEIIQHLIDDLKADSFISTLTGRTETDLRIYSYHPNMKLKYGPTFPATISYKFAFGDRPVLFSFPSQIGDASAIFRCGSIDKHKSSNLAEYIFTKFDFHKFTTLNYRVGIMMFTGIDESIPEGDSSKPIYIHNCSFDLREIFRSSAANQLFNEGGWSAT